MQSAKLKIIEEVKRYKILYPLQYKAVCDFIKGKRTMNRDQYASIEGTQAGTEMRALYEMPELLHIMIERNLTTEELLWLKVGESGRDNKGGRWFAKTFPEFRLPDLI